LAAVVATVCCASAPASAQRSETDEEASEATGEASRPEEELVPPRVVSVPEIALAPELTEELEDGAVDLRLAIDAGGRAEVEECSANEEVCARVREAIAGAVFEPARRGGEAIASRIAMRFRVGTDVVDPETGEAIEPDPTAEGVAGEPEVREAVRAEEDDDADAGFGAQAEVERIPAGVRRLTLEEARTLPGTFGDPFRAIEALPGVVPIFTGLPYFYIRGSPPSGTLYAYDEITLPVLFHFALGPSVIHPRMVGPLRLYSGAGPAHYGRYIGGIVMAEGPDEPEGRPEGEAEIRILDVNGFVSAPVGEGTLMAAGRIGWPGIVASIIVPGIKLNYWDYQVRFQHPLGRPGTRFELVALGSFDGLGIEEEEENDEGEIVTTTSTTRIQFHRVEARLIHRRRSFETGMALQFGWGRSSILSDSTDANEEDNLSVESFRFGPRLWLRTSTPRAKFRFGAEAFAATGTIRIPGEDTEGSTDPFLASVGGRNLGAIFGEVRWDPTRRVTFDLGLRSDLWITGDTAELAVDPRLRSTIHLSEDVDVHLALGVTRQPAVFFLPLPGLSEVAVADGPQRAVQTEVGLSIDPIEELHLEAQVFFHHYANLLFVDLFFQGETCLETGVACSPVEAPERVDGYSYGGEVFVRVDPAERLSGFLSYTLSWAELANLPAGQDYTPSYDVRHVLNLASRLHIVRERLSVGLRLSVRTGKPITVPYVNQDSFGLERYEQRLPVFVRLDAEIAYSWKARWGPRWRLALEWLNLTFSEEPVGIDCGELERRPTSACPVEFSPAIILPSVGIRGTFE